MCEREKECVSVSQPLFTDPDTSYPEVQCNKHILDFGENVGVIR